MKNKKLLTIDLVRRWVAGIWKSEGSERNWGSKAALALLLEGWDQVSIVMGGVPTRTPMLKSESARETRV